MEKVSENLLLFCRNLQANGVQFFWDTLQFSATANYLFLVKQHNFYQGREYSESTFGLRMHNYPGYHSEIVVHSYFPAISLDLAFECFLALL